MAVTIKDVAREAKVATSTVSRVLSNSSKISEETKIRVNEAIVKLNYTPNIIARGLANKKTRILAVVVAEEAENLFENQFFIKAMKGIGVCAQQENYYIMYAFKESGTTEKEWLKRFTDSNIVDGVCLLNTYENDESINYLKSINANFVVIGRVDQGEDILWVDNDNYKAMKEVVENLIGKGHRNIGFVGAKRHLNVSKDRLDGYKKALQISNIEINESIICEGSSFTEDTGYNEVLKIVENKNVTAIVGTDDLLAFGILKLLEERKINNIAVVSFNNTPVANFQKPPLASVDINSEKLGYYATKLLINKLENRDINKKKYIIETKLIERESINIKNRE